MNQKRDRQNSVCDIDLITFDNLTVIHMPLRHHHSQTLHFLLQEFSGHHWINRKGGPLSRTPLHYCCMYRFAEGLKLLLEFGADWTIKDDNGDTCLHLCFAYGHFEGLEELVKFITARRLRQYLRESDSSENGDQAPKSASQSSLPRPVIRQAVQKELAEFENITNEKGWRAEDNSFTFEMESRYKSLKETWIDRAVEEELAVRNTVETDSALSMHIYFPHHDRSTKMSLNSLTSSSLNVDTTAGSLSNSSLVGKEAGILSSPIQLIMQPNLASSRNGSIYDVVADMSPVTNLTSKPGTPTTTSVEKKNRQHSRSLLGATPEPTVPLQPRKRSSTSFAFGHRPPLLLVSRTPTLGQGSMPAPPQTPVLVGMLKMDLSKTPSLNSVTISPLVRNSKPRSSDDITTDLKNDPKLTRTLTLNSKSISSFITAAGTTAAGTLISTRSPFSLSPLKFALRRRSASTSNSPKTEVPIAPAARAAAEAAVRSRGPLTRLTQSAGSDRSSSKHPLTLKRNASTPVINSHFYAADGGFTRRNSRRQSVAEVVKGSPLHKVPVLESTSTEGSFDTIDLSTLLIDEHEIKHRVTTQVSDFSFVNARTNLPSSPVPDVDSTEKESDPPRSPSTLKIPQSLNVDSPGAPKRPSFSHHSTHLGGSAELKGSALSRGLVKKVSSISFTRVRDE